MTQFFLLYVFFTGVVVQFFFLGHNSWEIIQFNCIRYSWNFHHHRHYWIIDVLTILMDHWFFSVCVCVGVCLFLFLCVLCTAYGRINLRAFWQSIRDFFLLSIKYFGLRNFPVNQFFFKYRPIVTANRKPKKILKNNLIKMPKYQVFSWENSFYPRILWLKIKVVKLMKHWISIELIINVFRFRNPITLFEEKTKRLEPIMSNDHGLFSLSLHGHNHCLLF